MAVEADAQRPFKTVGARTWFGESPFFDARDGSVVHVDSVGKVIRHSPDGRITEWELPGKIAFAVPVNGNGYVVGLAGQGLQLFSADAKSLTPLSIPLPEGHRPNDATVDPTGRLIFGTRCDAGLEGVLLAAGNEGLHTLATGFGTINGLAVDARRSALFVADSHPDVQAVWRYHYHVPSGVLGERQRIFSFGDRAGRPDGAAVDSKGDLWLAEIEGGALLRISPRGNLLEEVRLPVSLPTKPCFDDRGQLWVTTASRGVDLSVEPLAGMTLLISAGNGATTSLARI